ncbi:MAG TPA: ACP phosphodiesterase, partial [Saprospiraceae bacterium]|nr:ACP phosphodiesterase [Saprospiraceae bacterium]
FNDFCIKVYEIIERHMDIAPEKVQNITKVMIDDDFLKKYSNIVGLDFVFNKMNKRARYEVDFKQSIKAIQLDDEFLNNAFNTFYPAIIKEVKVFCSC